jgi:hypothetical protein
MCLIEEFFVLGYNAVYRRFWGKCCLRLQGRRISQARNQQVATTCFMLLSCLAYSSTLKLDMTCSFETSDSLQRTTRRYIPEDRTLYNIGWGPQILHNVPNRFTLSPWKPAIVFTVREIKLFTIYIRMTHRASWGSSGCHCIYAWEYFLIERSSLFVRMLVLIIC